jgi:hypothetical protein
LLICSEPSYSTLNPGAQKSRREYGKKNAGDSKMSKQEVGPSQQGGSLLGQYEPHTQHGHNGHIFAAVR